ncbi:hypothetical protein D0A34_11895 [Microcoleus vaginatus PCC 9802]|nr:hypothetical protein D0A34_11895 [Microcoleus vaginatus PCC 9802]
MRSQLRLSNSYLKSSISPGVGELSAAVKYTATAKKPGFLRGLKVLKVLMQYFRPSNPVSA